MSQPREAAPVHCLELGLLPGDGWIGTMRRMCRVSMGESMNWPAFGSGWCRSIAGW